MKKIISIFILVSFIITGQIGTFPVYAQDLRLPVPGVMVHLSPEFNPPILKGIKIHPENPFTFDFILDKGDSKLFNNALKDESRKLIKYFLASLTIPEKDLWVNLSPYEKDRIIPNSFGLTEMGRDLLAEDYMLKQITASLIYPEDTMGKKFWKRIYEEAEKKLGTTNITINTFNKVWIVPEKAVIYENAKLGAVYIVESKLKVMLEEDYLSLQKHEVIQSKELGKNTNQIGSQIVREIVLPELTKEINEDKNFAQLRQVFNSLILATWYKKKIKDSILSQTYLDKNKVAGVNIDDPQEKQKIYERYLKAFKKGVYNYIKEEINPFTQHEISRKYFSGGELFTDLAMASALEIEDETNTKGLPTELPNDFIVSASLQDAAMQSNLPVVNENDVIFSRPGLGKLLDSVKRVWPNFQNEIGDAEIYPESTKTISIGGREFVFVRKQNGSRKVFTLNREEFEELAKLKGWKFSVTLLEVNDNDVFFSLSGFDKMLKNGQRIWPDFQSQVGDAKDYPDATKVIEVEGKKFILVRKQAGGKFIFTLNKKEFCLMANLKKWSLKEELPEVDTNDVIFSKSGFLEILRNGHNIWADFGKEVGEAEKHKDKTKVIKIEGQAFVLVRKKNKQHIVFTLDKEKFKRLAQLRGWKLNPELPKVDSNDVILAASGFEELVNGATVLEDFKKEMGEAESHQEATKVIEISEQKFELVRKMQGGGHIVFTLDREQFKKLVQLKGWKFKIELPKIDDNDVAFSILGLDRVITRSQRIWPEFKKRLGEAKGYPEATKTMEIGGRIFTFIRKRSGPGIVFTLNREEFNDLVKLEKWQLKGASVEKFIESNPDIQDAIASSVEDPDALFAYLMFTDVPTEMARGIVVESFRGIRNAARTIEDLEEFEGYTTTDDEIKLGDVPHETTDVMVTITGKVAGGFPYVQILGDRQRVIEADEEGNFVAKFILQRGRAATLGFFGFDEESQSRSQIESVTIHQTSPPKDIETIFDELLVKRQELQEKISSNKEQLRYLIQRLEISALKHFTEDEQAGFVYLDEKIAKMTSPFMKQLYRFIREKFEHIAQLQVADLRAGERLYFYQKYAIYEIQQRMADTKNPEQGVILALEQGLGKTMVVLSTIRKDSQGAAIVVPNAVVTAWGEQEGHFFTDQTTEIITGTGVQKARKIQRAGKAPKVVNLEYIRDQRHVEGLNNNPEQVLVLDESQFISRPGSQQSRGAQNIKSRFKILVSATPFANTKASRAVLKFLESGNRGLEDANIFNRVFNLDDAESLRLLHFWFNQYLIRIRKRDVFKEYDRSRPLEEQKDRLPAKDFTPSEELGGYELTDGQAEAILQMFTDWPGWVARKIASGVRTEDDRLIQAREHNENYFSKMHSLRQMSNNPRYIGLEEGSPKLKEADKIVEKEVIDQNGKVVIFCQYRDQVKEYLKRYAHLNPVSYYGDTEKEVPTKGGFLATEDGKLRKFKKKNKHEFEIGADGRLIEDVQGDPISPLDYNRLVFQNDPNARVLIATYESGSVGVTFTAADAVIFDDLARDYTVQYQAEDRANRIDNLRKKYAVRYYHLIAKYSEAFLDKVRDLYQVTDKTTGEERIIHKDSLTEDMERDQNLEIENVYDLYFANGTYDQVHFKNIQSQRRIFELILDGLQDQDETDLLNNKRLKEKFPGLFTVTRNGKTIDEEPEEEFNEIEGNGNENGNGGDEAMNSQIKEKSLGPGGIDLTTNDYLQTKNSGSEIKFHMDYAMLKRLQNAPGFVPVIINIQPMTDLRRFLGLDFQKVSTII